MRSETNRFPRLFLFPPFLEGWKGGLDSHGELWLLGNHPTNPRRSPGGSHDGPFCLDRYKNGVKISSPRNVPPAFFSSQNIPSQWSLLWNFLGVI